MDRAARAVRVAGLVVVAEATAVVWAVVEVATANRVGLAGWDSYSAHFCHSQQAALEHTPQAPPLEATSTPNWKIVAR